MHFAIYNSLVSFTKAMSLHMDAIQRLDHTFYYDNNYRPRRNPTIKSLPLQASTIIPSAQNSAEEKINATSSKKRKLDGNHLANKKPNIINSFFSKKKDGTELVLNKGLQQHLSSRSLSSFNK